MSGQQLGIPLENLQTRMTGVDRISLGQAIQELRPNLPPETVSEVATEAAQTAQTAEQE